MLNIEKIYINCTEGNYNWCNPNETQWQLVLAYWVDGKRYSVGETFNEEPDWEGEAPEVILDLIEERVNSYWVSTSRDEQLEKINNLRASIDEVHTVWAKCRIDRLQSEIDKLSEEIEELQSYL